MIYHSYIINLSSNEIIYNYIPSNWYVVNASWMNELVFFSHCIIFVWDRWDRVQSNSLSFGVDKENCNEIHNVGKSESGFAREERLWSILGLVWFELSLEHLKERYSTLMETCFSKQCGFLLLSTLLLSHCVDTLILRGLISPQVLRYLCYSYFPLSGICLWSQV